MAADPTPSPQPLATITHPIQVMALSPQRRNAILQHFLSLSKEARYLRFGGPTADTFIEQYVGNMNFYRDAVFGVFDENLVLAGVAHLAANCPLLSLAAEKGKKVAEFGVSVLHPYRGQGIGTALFQRVLPYCRNRNVMFLYMHCLTSNSGIMKIARRSGMDINYDHGEANAYLSLPHSNLATLLEETIEQQAARWDYALKSGRRESSRLFETIHPQPQK